MFLIEKSESWSQIFKFFIIFKNKSTFTYFFKVLQCMNIMTNYLFQRDIMFKLNCKKYHNCPSIPSRETSCTKMETKDMNSIKRKSVLGRDLTANLQQGRKIILPLIVLAADKKNLSTFFAPLFYFSFHFLIYNLS